MSPCGRSARDETPRARTPLRWRKGSDRRSPGSAGRPRRAGGRRPRGAPPRRQRSRCRAPARAPDDLMRQLVLLRHGESTWNRENRFTGWTDGELTEKGIEEARSAALLLKQAEYEFDV